MLQFISNVIAFIFVGGMAAIAITIIISLLSIPFQVYLEDKSCGIEKLKTLMICIALFIFILAFTFFGSGAIQL